MKNRISLLLLSFLAIGLAANAATDTAVEGAAAKAPAVVNTVAPEYPADARAKGLEGVVVVQCLVDAKGEVLAVGSLEKKKTMLTDSAIAAVKQWRFAPRTDAAPVMVQIPVRFELHEGTYRPEIMNIAAR